MRLKKLLSMTENALNGTGMDNTPKADMFLSSRVLAISLVFAIAGDRMRCRLCLHLSRRTHRCLSASSCLFLFCIIAEWS